MTINPVIFNSLTKCRFDMGVFNCISIDKILLAVGLSAGLLCILIWLNKIAKEIQEC